MGDGGGEGMVYEDDHGITRIDGDTSWDYAKKIYAMAVGQL